MGTWDIGPFDNDGAADWCGNLHDADPAERVGVIRQTLRQAAEENGFLDSREGERAVAAAAVIVSQLPGGVALASSYAPDFLTDGNRLEVPVDLPALAVRALDRVLAADSEWVELWEETNDPDAAFAVVRNLRAELHRLAA
ncbi:hypothetical protein Cs7R123_46930 [Catellatospora sp. TT07R-123]|uniref:DUF4259 domain-containing protein n=1 Tax=Catellatospora sp. TT07R-123 TaxID=2733863 RepID=UPI001B0DB45B|nr:DUF4259 domain-containing protein [Catellatospora sp. TT07R-123]GHJ47351.1 hypothetical protein Cs7R123_46930 [Catellatospora sp. TT07R-123]